MGAPGQYQCRLGSGWWKCPAIALLAAAAEILGAGSAAAHGAERGFVLLLPTGYFILGGAAAVAATFFLVALVSPHAVDRLARARLRLGTLPAISPVPTSCVSFLLLILLLLAGLYGSRDPLANPLPLAIWTLWWVGIALLHPLVGNLWALINPWSGPYRLLDAIAGGRLARAPLAYPVWLGYWPAVGFFLGFAWLELVYPAPTDPERLAVAVGLYWLIAFIGMALFGERAWMERAEPFSFFFRLIAGLSPIVISPAEGEGRHRVALAVPGIQLLEREPLPISGILFVLLTLSAVSFDGLSKTFWWLGLGHINPLEYPGRGAVMGRNSIGLVLAFGALATLYVAAVRLGWVVNGMRQTLRPALGTFVYSIVPISVAFHFSHYLTALLVDGQYAVLAASDPFGSGLDLFGLGRAHVTTSFLTTYEGVRTIWSLQIAAIILGHIAAIVMAHALALRHLTDGRHVAVTQAPLALLMVLYTLFGLWLLSTPAAG